MNINLLGIVLIPFIGTTLGSAMVYFMKDQMKRNTERALMGFASGVMVAASIFSLLVPALEESSHLGKWSFMPSVIGFWLGTGFLLLLDQIIPHLHQNAEEAEGLKSNFTKKTMMILAVTLHNIPEGMAVGVVLAAFLSGQVNLSYGAVFALSLGIAIQNFPEGAIISMPLKAEGKSKNYGFLAGSASGIVEPIASIITIIFTQWISPLLPYVLSFASGAMFYVVVEELIPEMSEGKHSNIPVVLFSIGFTLMMALDVALG